MTLSDTVQQLSGVGSATVEKFASLDIVTIKDLLYHIPFRYDDFTNTPTIEAAEVDTNATIQATVHSITSFAGQRGRIVKAVVTDDTGKMELTWFNQPYVLMSLRKGMVKRFSGKVTLYNKKKSIANPGVEDASVEESLHSGRLVPIYSVNEEVTSRSLRNAAGRALHSVEEFTDRLPLSLISSHELMSLKDALYTLHFPDTLEKVEDARRRMAFEEVYSLLIDAKERQSALQLMKVPKQLKLSAKEQKAFESSLSFSLTSSQTRALFDLSLDLAQPYPTNRLIQGEVGSGKTMVAAFALYVAALNNTTGLLVAPTQIVAEQHFRTLQPIFTSLGIPVELITAQSIQNEHPTANTIYIGTHALFEKKRGLHPNVVVIDEEHRFGVRQRETFWTSAKKRPHLITMTATPIPRTVALTVLADREVSQLEEIAEFKKDVSTRVVTEAKRAAAYDWIREEIVNKKAQVFVVCPFIQQSANIDLNNVKAAEEEYKKILKLFPKQKIALIHGKVPQETRAAILKTMREGKLDILVSTPIIEVGIDIPQASIMLIEGAERFGLAQLHQLRGRVGRAGQKAYCLLLPSEHIETTTKRLKIMETHTNGAELAELDLKLRGTGEFFGTKQHGWDSLKFASWSDEELIEECKKAVETAAPSR